MEIKKISIIASIISALHFVEDINLFWVGRYTEITLPLVLVGVVSLSLILAVLARNKKIKRFIGS